MALGLAANPYTKATFGNYMSGNAHLAGFTLALPCHSDPSAEGEESKIAAIKTS